MTQEATGHRAKEAGDNGDARALLLEHGPQSFGVIFEEFLTDVSSRRVNRANMREINHARIDTMILEECSDEVTAQNLSLADDDVQSPRTDFSQSVSRGQIFQKIVRFPLNLYSEIGKQISRSKARHGGLNMVIADVGDNMFISGRIAFCRFRSGFE